MKWAIATCLLLGCVGPPMGTRAEDCGVCHVEQLERWKVSRHAVSRGSPVFEAMLEPVEKAWGANARARCVACHSPGHGGDEVIGCVSCHAAIGNRGEGNGALVVDLDAPLAGPNRKTNSAHRTVERGFLKSASLCGTCHEVHGPGLLEEPTLTELRASSFGAADSCLTCHEDDHRFGGIDPPWGASPEEATRSAEAARNLLSGALHLEVLGDGTGVVVRLTNEQTGHAVPTGITALRDLWVDVLVTGPTGERNLPRVMELGSRLTRDAVEVALPTDATRIESRAIAPGEARQIRLEVAAGETVVVALRARAIRAVAMTALGLDGRASEVPELEVLSARWSPP